MTRKKVLEAIDIYRNFFEEREVKKKDYPHHVYVCLRRDILAHCYGMLGQMEEFVKEFRMGKAFRWLGFIQGCLWALGCHTLEELKNHNRPSEVKPATPEEIRERRHEIAEEIAYLKGEVSDLGYELKQLQICCPHVSEVSHIMSGIVTRTCCDCGKQSTAWTT